MLPTKLRSGASSVVMSHRRVGVDDRDANLQLGGIV
jgi:hypothetical protein